MRASQWQPFSATRDRQLQAKQAPKKEGNIGTSPRKAACGAQQSKEKKKGGVDGSKRRQGEQSTIDSKRNKVVVLQVVSMHQSIPHPILGDPVAAAARALPSRAAPPAEMPFTSAGMFSACRFSLFQ